MKRVFSFMLTISIVFSLVNFPSRGPLVNPVSASDVQPVIRWVGQSVTLEDIAWKPDNSYGLIIGENGLVLKYDGYDFEVLTTTLGYNGYDVAWKPDGSYALIVGTGGQVSKYDEVSFSSLTSPTTNDLRQVGWKSDGAYALLVGNKGTLLKYDGSAFTKIETFTTADLHSVDWDVSDSNALIAGASGTMLLYRHSDGKVYWLGEDVSLEDIAWNPDNTLGLIVGYGGLCLGYNGVRFSVLNDSLGFDALGVNWKPDGSQATIVGKQGHITKYSAGAFTSVSSPTTNDLYAVSWRQDGSYALIAGASGTLLAFNGVSVAVIQSKTNSNLNGIGWNINSEKALIVGDSGNAIIFDAGNNKVYWLGQDISLTDIAWKPDNSYGLIVGYEGIVLRYDGTTFTRLITGLSGVLYDAAWKPDGSYAVLVGSEGIAVKYDGISFSSLPQVTTNDLNKIAWAPDDSFALVVGDGGTILKFDGSSFEPILPIMEGLTHDLESVAWHPGGEYAIVTGKNGVALRYDAIEDRLYWLGHNIALDTIAWRPDGSYGLIVGEGGAVIKYDGSNFEPLITGLATQLYDVSWNHAGTTALILGSEGIAVKYDGVSFASLATNTTNNLYEIGWSPDDSYALVVGAQGLVLKYVSGGFTHLISPTNVDLNGISWNATHALVVGNSGAAFSWNGTGFESLNSGTSNKLWDVEWKPDGSYALVVSQYGEILKFDGSTFSKDSSGDYYDFYGDYRCSVDWNPSGLYALITGYNGYYGGSIWRYDGVGFNRYSLRGTPWGVTWRNDGGYALIVGNAGEAVKYDGSNFAYASAATQLSLWDVAWRPNGSYALVVSQYGEIMKFDGSIFSHDSSGDYYDFYGDYKCKVDWNPNGLYALITGYNGYYGGSIWRYDESEITRYPLRYIPQGVSWKSNSSYSLIVGQAGEVVGYDGSNFLYLSTSTNRKLWSADWRPDGSYALVVSQYGEVLKFDGVTFSYDSSDYYDFYGDYKCKVNWNPNGLYALITGYNGYYGGSLWRYNGTSSTRFDLRRIPRSVNWRSDGGFAMIIGSVGEVLSYDGTSFLFLSSTTSAHLWDVAWRPDGSYALVVSQYGEVLKFDGVTFSYDSSDYYDFYGEYRCSVDWNPNGLYALITGYNGYHGHSMWRYDGATFFRYTLRNRPCRVEWRADGSYSLIVGEIGQVIQYDGVSLLYRSTSTSRTLWDISWKPDGSYALIISQYGEMLKFDGSIYAYDYGDYYDFYQNPSKVDWSSNGIWSVITGHSGYYGYSIWRYDGATLVRVSLDVMPWDVSFQPGGDYCMVVGESGHAWTYDSINLLPISTGVTTAFYGVMWKPDGSYALIVGQSGTVLKYDGLWVTPLSSGVTQDLKAVAWSRDGSYALIVGNSGTVLKFDGSNFTPLSSGVMQDLLSADFGSTSALIVGKSGRLLKYENDIFTPIALNTTADLQGVDWTPAGDYAVVTGPDGRAWKVYSGLPPSPLKVSVTADPTVLKSGAISSITISVRNDSVPVAGATAVLRSAIGGIFSTVVDQGDGNYTSDYTAPLVTEYTNDRITATISKIGFSPGFGFVDIAILAETPYLQQIQKHFPYWRFSKDEQYFPTSFYFDNDADANNNTINYYNKVGEWNTKYAYIHIATDQNYVTIGYWLYYAYNDWLGPFDDHNHDWDSVLYIVLNASTLDPIMIGFSHHIQLSYLNWNDPALEKIDDHPITYVAEGSHAAYNEPNSMTLPPYFDKWSQGGITLGPENLTNLVIVGSHVNERQFLIEDELTWFCQMNYENINCTHPSPSEAMYGGKPYWPKKFPTGNPVLDLFTDWDDAPWHRTNKWYSTIPQGVISSAAFIVHSPVNLYITDPEGHHLGTNETGQVIMEMEGALYSGPDAEPEVIIIPNPTEKGYKLNVIGVQTGTFNLTILQTLNETIVYEEQSNTVQIEQGEKIDLSVPLGQEILTRHEIIVEDASYDVWTRSNSTLWNFAFNKTLHQLRFDVSGPLATKGTCNVTIPSNLIWGEISVSLDGTPLVKDIDYTQTYNGTHYILYLSYNHSFHKIEITSQYVVPEFTSLTTLILLIALTLIATALTKVKTLRHKRPIVKQTCGKSFAVL